MMNLAVICGRSVVFSSTTGSSTNKTDCHDITEILLKVALNTINQTISGLGVLSNKDFREYVLFNAK
jgi:hypothetical protein